MPHRHVRLLCRRRFTAEAGDRSAGPSKEDVPACQLLSSHIESDMTEREARLKLMLSVIKGEYQEMPGLHLTKTQVQRLWGLDPSECDLLLEVLQATDFLRVTARGDYVVR